MGQPPESPIDCIISKMYVSICFFVSVPCALYSIVGFLDFVILCGVLAIYSVCFGGVCPALYTVVAVVAPFAVIEATRSGFSIRSYSTCQVNQYYACNIEGDICGAQEMGDSGILSGTASLQKPFLRQRKYITVKNGE